VESTEHLTFERRGRTAVVTMNRPEAKNALSLPMLVGMADAWVEIDSNDEIRCAVLTGAGERAFCVGIDRNAPDTYVVFEKSTLYGTSNNYMYDDPGRDLGPKANDLWKPVVCAVHGTASEGVTIEVSDQGMSPDPGALNALMDGRDPGTANDPRTLLASRLGLVMVRMVAEANGGRADAVAEPRRTTVRMVLPASA